MKSLPKPAAKKSKYVESDSESDEESDNEIAPVSKKGPVAKKSLPKKPAAKKSKYDESDSETNEESDKENEEEEQEYVPKKGKRGPLVERSAIPAKKVAKKPQSGNCNICGKFLKSHLQKHITYVHVNKELEY